MSTPDEILRFWLEDGLELGWPSRNLGDLWFGGGQSVDQHIRERFGNRVSEALDGDLASWEALPLHRLALVVLLDQFTRNVFRADARAFSGDARAQALTLDAIDRRQDVGLPLVGRVFLAMPLMHAEDLEMQHRCVGVFESLLAAAPPDRVEGLRSPLESAREHRDIVARFGRFPHRNAVLGRVSSAPERAYLDKGKRFGQ